MNSTTVSGGLNLQQMCAPFTRARVGRHTRADALASLAIRNHYLVVRANLMMGHHPYDALTDQHVLTRCLERTFNGCCGCVQMKIAHQDAERW